MSKYLENLKRWSKNKKLIYSSDKWLKAISHMNIVEKDNHVEDESNQLTLF